VFDSIYRMVKTRFTFMQGRRNPISGEVEPVFKRISIYAQPDHNAEAHARARLPWHWTDAPLVEREVLRV